MKLNGACQLSYQYVCGGGEAKKKPKRKKAKERERWYDGKALSPPLHSPKLHWY